MDSLTLEKLLDLDLPCNLIFKSPGFFVLFFFSGFL